MDTRLLAFDTATERMCIALLWGERHWLHDSDGGPRASGTLIPAALGLLAEAGFGLDALDAIGFGRGPGAFTGLRATCSVAQGFACGADLPVLPIDSLLLVADDAHAQTGDTDVWVAMDARMDELYAAHYVRDGDRWRVVDAPALLGLEPLHARWQERAPHTVAGTALDAFGERLATGTARRVPRQHARAAALARLVRAAWHDGPRLDAADARPLYLRDKVALTSAEQQARRGARMAAEGAAHAMAGSEAATRAGRAGSR